MDCGQLLGREDAVDIQNHDELGVALAHALDKVGANMGADARRGLNLLGLEIDDFFDRIGQRSDDGGFVVEQHFDNDDAGVARALGLRHLESRA